MAKKKFAIQKYHNLKWLLLILVIVILLPVFKAYYSKNINNNTGSYENTSISPTISISNWQTYDDQVNGYTIKYPENWNYQKIVNGGESSVRFYENGVSPRQSDMMTKGNEQLILSTITNQTLKGLDESIKIQQTTIAGRPALRLSTGAYIELSSSPSLILSVYAPRYPQPVMDGILESLVINK